MTNLKLLGCAALTAAGAAASPALAVPGPGSPHVENGALLQQAAYRCYYRHGYRHCRYYSYYDYPDYYSDYPYYDYGWGPGIAFGFGGFGHGFHHGFHGGHMGHH